MSALATESYRQVFMPHYLEFDLCLVMKIIVASRMRKLMQSVFLLDYLLSPGGCQRQFKDDVPLYCKALREDVQSSAIG